MLIYILIYINLSTFQFNQFHILNIFDYIIFIYLHIFNMDTSCYFFVRTCHISCSNAMTLRVYTICFGYLLILLCFQRRLRLRHLIPICSNGYEYLYLLYSKLPRSVSRTVQTVDGVLAFADVRAAGCIRSIVYQWIE